MPFPKSTNVVVSSKPLVRLGMVSLLNASMDSPCITEVSGYDDLHRAIEEVEPSLVITDICFGSSLHLDLPAQIRARLPKSRILILSSLSESIFAERTMRSGADGFVGYNAAVASIRYAISAISNGESYLSEQMKGVILGRAIGKETDVASRLQTLTDRELHVWQQLGAGSSNRHIAENLELSVKTIDTYRDRIKTKLNLQSTYELIRLALECAVFGLAESDPLRS